MACRLYMNPSGTVYKLDQPTGCTLSALDVARDRLAVEAPGNTSGSCDRLSYGARFEITIEFTYTLGSSDLKDWHNRLQEWLEVADRGLPVAIARSSAYAGLWPLRDSGDTEFALVVEGDNTLYAGSDDLGYETSPALAAGDLAIVEGEPAASQVWPFRVSSWTAGTPKTVVAATAARASLGTYAWLRHQDFWPYLYRHPEDLGVQAFALDAPTADLIRFRARFLQRLPEVS